MAAPWHCEENINESRRSHDTGPVWSLIANARGSSVSFVFVSAAVAPLTKSFTFLSGFRYSLLTYVLRPSIII